MILETIFKCYPLGILKNPQTCVTTSAEFLFLSHFKYLQEYLMLFLSNMPLSVVYFINKQVGMAKKKQLKYLTKCYFAGKVLDEK